MPHSNDLKLAAAAATDRILLAEYTEEHPVYLNRPGMAMHIVDYAHADAPPPDATPPAARHPAATASGDAPRVRIGDAPRVTAPTGTRREVSDSAPLPLALGAKVNDGGNEHCSEMDTLKGEQNEQKVWKTQNPKNQQTINQKAKFHYF